MKYDYHVLVYAYFQFNLGDDLLVKELVKRYPSVCFHIIANKDYKRVFKNLTNTKILYEQTLINRILKKFAIYEKKKNRFKNQCNYAVYIGGSIFMEYENWDDQDLWYRTIFEPKRLFFIGCNWGPCKTYEFKRKMATLFEETKDVCFRDTYSYNEFSILPTIRYAPDILFGIDEPEGRKKVSFEEKKQVFISVIDCASKDIGGKNLANYESQYISFLLNIIRIYLDKSYTIKLVSFCHKEKDYVAFKKIRSELNASGNERIFELEYNGKNDKEIIKELIRSKVVVGSRFHATILGLRFHKEVIPIVYSDKTKNVLQDLKVEHYWDIREKQSLISSCANLSVKLSEDQIQILCNDAKKHFELLDLYTTRDCEE